MYTGPGSGPMLAAAAAWDELAAELYLNASFYGLVISDLTSVWLGPSSASMAAAATPFVSWITTTAGQAEQTGAQAMAAVAAYEAAFAMTVPPPVIAANRALLMMLIATNFFGQNFPAIAATEAHYMEMWAQDAAAMYGYQGASQAASALTPFTPAQQTTNPAGLAGQAAAVGQASATSAGTSAQTVAPLASAVSTPLTSAVSAPLSSAAAPNALSAAAISTASTTSSSSSTLPLSSVSSLSSSSTALTSGTGVASGAGSGASMGTSAMTMLLSTSGLMNSVSPAASTLSSQLQAFGSTLGGGVGSGTSMFGSVGMGNAVTAGVGRAASLGMLSVPQGWASAAPAFSQVSSILPAASGGATPPVMPGGPGGMLGGPPMLANATRGGAPGAYTPRFGFRPNVVQPPVYAG